MYKTFSKCLKIDAISANFILTLFVKIWFLFTTSIQFMKKKQTYVDTYGHRLMATLVPNIYP